MKRSFAAFTFVAAAQAYSAKQDTEIVAGVFYGITQQEGLTELSGCMHDSDRFVAEIVHGVEMIVEFDLRSVIAGTRSIARAVHHLPAYLDECENTEADLKTLESWAHIFIEPVNLVQTIAGNALHNLPKVSVDVLKARRDLKEQKFFAFGDEVGKLLAFLTTPLSEEELQALINQE